MNSRPFWCTQEVPGQSELCTEIVFQITTTIITMIKAFSKKKKKVNHWIREANRDLSKHAINIYIHKIPDIISAF